MRIDSKTSRTRILDEPMEGRLQYMRLLIGCIEEAMIACRATTREMGKPAVAMLVFFSSHRSPSCSTLHACFIGLLALLAPNVDDRIPMREHESIRPPVRRLCGGATAA